MSMQRATTLMYVPVRGGFCMHINRSQKHKKNLVPNRMNKCRFLSFHLKSPKYPAKIGTPLNPLKNALACKSTHITI